MNCIKRGQYAVEMFTLLLGAAHISTESRWCLLNRRSSLFFWENDGKSWSLNKKQSGFNITGQKLKLFVLLSFVFPRLKCELVTTKKLFERRWISSHMKEEVTSDQVKLLWHDLITLLSWLKKCSGLFKGPDSPAWTLDCCFSGHMLVEQQPTICDIFLPFKGLLAAHTADSCFQTRAQ